MFIGQGEQMPNLKSFWIIYLENWGEKATSDFVKKVYAVLEILSLQPEIGSLQNTEKNIRGFVVVKQVTLFYKLQGNTLILLNFFGNFQHPKKRF